MRVLVVAAAALLRRDPTTGVTQVLLAQRPEGKSLAGLWEFPGAVAVVQRLGVCVNI